MLASLPAGYRKLPMASVAELSQAEFTSYDGYALMEAVWGGRRRPLGKRHEYRRPCDGAKPLRLDRPQYPTRR